MHVRGDGKEGRQADVIEEMGTYVHVGVGVGMVIKSEESLTLCV